MKLNTGEVVKQFLLNWLDSIANGKLNDGTTIEEAIAELRLNGGGGTGEGNIFSPQFKLIDGKIYWDPAYFLAKYPTSSTYEYLFDRFTSTSGASALTDVGAIGKYNFNTVASRLRMECDVRITNNTATDLTGVGIGIAQDFTISFGSEVAIDPLSSEWQTVSFDYPPAATLTEFNNVVIALRSSSGNLESINGSILDVKNVKIYDEENNLIKVTSVAGYNATYSEEQEGSVVVESDLKGTRVQGLILTGAGVKPTLPANGVKPGDTEWLDTDILPNEILALNITDEKFYYNNGTEIKEFTGGGDIKRQERFSLIGHTDIPTAFEEAVNISSVPKYLNLSGIKLIDLSDSSEIAILTAGALEELPITVPAGDYNYSISYEEGKESGVLLINFS